MHTYPNIQVMLADLEPSPVLDGMVVQKLKSIGTDLKSYGYLAEIQFGTSPQSFDLLLDTGSSWTWVDSCNSEIHPQWKENECPEYYFNEDASSTLQCTDEYKFIKYGRGAMNGQICKDYMQVTGESQEFAKGFMPFLSNQHKWPSARNYFSGILGMAPNDESAGPLLMEYIF